MTVRAAQQNTDRELLVLSRRIEIAVLQLTRTRYGLS